MKRRHFRGGPGRMLSRAPFNGGRAMVVRKWRRCAGRKSDLVGFPRPALLGSQHDSAGDFAFAQQIERLVGFGKRPLNHMAEYLSGGGHGEYFPQFSPSTNR